MKLPVTTAIIRGIFLVSLVSGCASLDQQPIEFRTSSDIVFKLNSKQYDTVDIQHFETQLWRDSVLVVSVMSMETNAAFSTAVEEVGQGFKEAQKSFADVTELNVGKGIYGFSASVDGYTTAFIATSNHPSSWVAISTTDDVFDEVLPTLAVVA